MGHLPEHGRNPESNWLLSGLGSSQTWYYCCKHLGRGQWELLPQCQQQASIGALM